MKRTLVLIVLAGLGLAGCVVQQQWHWMDRETFASGSEVEVVGWVIDYEGTEPLSVLDVGDNRRVVVNLDNLRGWRALPPGYQVRATGDWGMDHRQRPVVFAYKMDVLYRPPAETQPPPGRDPAGHRADIPAGLAAEPIESKHPLPGPMSMLY
jgi:hypothetical protein